MSLNTTDKKALLEIVHIIDEKKGEEVSVLDMRQHSIAASFFVLANGTNPKHVRAIAEDLEEKFSGDLLRREGLDSGSWVVLDYGEYFVHVFDEDVRLFYDLEGLWADYEVPLDNLQKA
ncbi:ribosome silencing factor [Candidatus Bipolaricaulota bacterium]|nr:ribosome silencing factor [Candidatus Bipolaricaulota bacterium]